MTAKSIRLSRQKLITCIIPKGAGRKVLLGLRQDHAINTSNLNMARGAGMYNPLAKRGIGEQTEKEIVTVVVPMEKAEEIFEYIYFLAEIGEPHKGIIFQSDLICASPYTMPEGIAEEQG